MAIKVYPKDGDVQVTPCERNDNCFPVYDPGCESDGPVCCPTQCKPDPCPPFHARDAIRIREFEVERTFDIRSVCGDRPFMALQRCMVMEFKRPCDCDWQWDVKPLRVTTDGQVVFRWPTEFLRAEPGYWYVRLVVDGQPVKYLPFYKPFAKVNVHSTEPTEDDRCGRCHEPWSVCCCDRPEVDEEPWEYDPECGGCKSDRCD